MKKVFSYLLCVLGLISCYGQNGVLKTEELKLIQEINLDQITAEKIKQNAIGSFEVSKGNNERDIIFGNFEKLKNYSINLPKAIKIKVKAENANQIIKSFKEELWSKKLIIYKSEENYGTNDDVLTILQSENKFEPLLFEATNAVNYDLYTPQIIDKLKKWDSAYGVELYGIRADFVSGEFSNQPKDIKNFVKEIYEFCPDIVDQGVGDINKLENTLKETNKFFLWWD